MKRSLIARFFNFDRTPFISGVLAGVSLGVVIVVGFFALALLLVAMEKITGDVGGAGGVVGFILLPIAMFIGAPWSIIMFNSLGANTFLVGIAAGILINGFIIGFIIGAVAKVRNAKSTRV